MTAADYLQQFQALLPSGAAWPREPDTNLTRSLLALAAEYSRLDARADDLLREFQPSTAVELLPEWETEYGIIPLAGATIQERQQLAAWYHVTDGDIKKPYYVALAAMYGFTIRIDDYIAPIIGYYAIGDMLCFEAWQDFSAGVSGAGDNLGMESSPALLPACWLVVILAGPANPAPELEALLLDLKPGHIHLNFVYLEVV